MYIMNEGFQRAAMGYGRMQEAGSGGIDITDALGRMYGAVLDYSKRTGNKYIIGDYVAIENGRRVASCKQCLKYKTAGNYPGTIEGYVPYGNGRPYIKINNFGFIFGGANRRVVVRDCVIETKWVLYNWNDNEPYLKIRLHICIYPDKTATVIMPNEMEISFVVQ